LPKIIQICVTSFMDDPKANLHNFSLNNNIRVRERFCAPLSKLVILDFLELLNSTFKKAVSGYIAHELFGTIFLKKIAIKLVI
jgi:hypothetical protein